MLESHFEPYVAKLIPPLLAHIQEELKFDVFVAKYTIILRMMGVSGSDRRWSIEYEWRGIPYFRKYACYSCRMSPAMSLAFTSEAWVMWRWCAIRIKLLSEKWVAAHCISTLWIYLRWRSHIPTRWLSLHVSDGVCVCARHYRRGHEYFYYIDNWEHVAGYWLHYQVFSASEVISSKW